MLRKTVVGPIIECHIKIRISHVGSKAQYEGGCQKSFFVGPLRLCGHSRPNTDRSFLLAMDLADRGPPSA